jgi:peptide deformylase
VAVKKIVQIPDSVLTTPCKRVDVVDGAAKKLAKDLLDTVRAAQDPGGAGLAAPQIGVSKNVCIIRKFQSKDENAQVKDYILINPEITSFSKSTDIKWEGCLSIPDTYGRVQRSKRVTVVGIDENGNKVRIKASGFFARVIQHEVDHLNGVLFTSKVIGETRTEES